MKKNIFLLYFIIYSFNSFGQFQNEEKKNRHTIGVGLIPLTSSLFIHNTYHFNLNYGFFFKPNVIGYASMYYFNNGKEYHGNILGVEGNAQFLLTGNQLKLGFRNIINFNNIQSKDYNAYTYWGLSFAKSNYEIKQDIAIRDFLGNIGYDKKYDNFSSLTYEFQLGLIFKINNKLSILTGCGIGIASNDSTFINTKDLPAIGFIGRELGPFLNFSIDLFYNFNK
ncbi:MAG: hypothetical protein WCI53_04090 [Bacteroidota bacterium]|jgi:hypothetical protein